jgi:3-hydroxypropanoate dehydrogenase
MNDIGTAASDALLDRIFRKARSFDVFDATPVADADLRAIYEIAKWGPTTANSQPQRIVFVRSQDAKDKLAPALSSANRKKMLGAPVTAIFAFDMRFFEHLPRLFHNPAARSWYETTPEHIRTTAMRNATLQAAYFMIAARACGFDCGPMSGFKNDQVDAAFFPDGRFKSNFICAIGRGDPSALPPQDPRTTFDEACQVL